MKIFIFLILIVNSIFALNVPQLNGRINDYAGIMNVSSKNEIKNYLLNFEKKNSTQIAILTISSLEGESIEEYSLKVAEKWGIGQKDKDNGVLLLISKDDRRIRIEVGNGLEPVLTDLICSRIIRNILAPQFRRGKYGAGVYDAVKAIGSVVDGTYKSNPKLTKSRRKKKNNPFVGIFIIIFIIFSFFRGSRRGGLFSIFLASSLINSSSSGSSDGGFFGDGGFSGFSGGGGGFSGGGSSGGW